MDSRVHERMHVTHMESCWGQSRVSFIAIDLCPVHTPSSSGELESAGATDHGEKFTPWKSAISNHFLPGLCFSSFIENHLLNIHQQDTFSIPS